MSKVPTYTMRQRMVIIDKIKAILTNIYPGVYIRPIDCICRIHALVYKDRRMTIELTDEWMYMMFTASGVSIGMLESALRQWVDKLKHGKPPECNIPTTVPQECDYLRLEDFL